MLTGVSAWLGLGARSCFCLAPGREWSNRRGGPNGWPESCRSALVAVHTEPKRKKSSTRIVIQGINGIAVPRCCAWWVFAPRVRDFSRG